MSAGDRVIRPLDVPLVVANNILENVFFDWPKGRENRSGRSSEAAVSEIRGPSVPL